MAIIRYIYADYMKAVEAIIRQPHHTLQTIHEILPSHKAKRIDNKTVSWIEKHNDKASYENGHIKVEKILAARKEIVFDTKENQLIKFILQSTAKRLNGFKRNYIAMDRVKNAGADKEGVIEPINKMLAGINSKLNSTFLKEISSFHGQGQLSLVFSMAPGYRELYAYYLILQHGLDLSGDLLHMSLKDLADLYEYWCFVKLNSLLNAKYKLTSKDMIRANRSGIFVTLVKNKQKSIVRYKTACGDRISIAYNASGKYPTGPQKPDNTLSMSKATANGENTYQYVFDAKYKVNPALEGTYYYNHISKTPGPEEEDINTMHRYRDAIVSLHDKDRPWERLMFGAYVLFPLSGGVDAIEQYKNHVFYKSVKEVNIGGLPFLPSSTCLVEELLDELIEESANEADDRIPRQTNMYDYAKLYKAYSQLTEMERKAIEYVLDNDEYQLVVEKIEKRNKKSLYAIPKKDCGKE